MIKKLLNEKIIGYACVVTTTIRKKNKSEYEKKIKETKAYELISNMLNPDNIVIDVISGSYRKRKELLEIIDTFEHNTVSENEPKGCLVIPSISDLGTTPEEFKKNYLMLCQKNIAILFLDNETLSTTDYSWEYRKSLSEIENALSALTENDFPSRQGRKKKPLTVTAEFKKLYWYFENYFIMEKFLYKNHLIGKITKVAFNQLCDIYEQSEEYMLDEIEQEQKYHISQKPKRHGAVPNNFAMLINMVENSHSLNDACDKLNIKKMTQITYKRFKIKAEYGRSSTTKATFQFHNNELENSIISNP